ncbi:hypothetical protein CP09DC79_0819A, partial [Chlamydia psittaci 09DC79]
MSKSPTAFSIK